MPDNARFLPRLIPSTYFPFIYSPLTDYSGQFLGPLLRSSGHSTWLTDSEMLSSLSVVVCVGMREDAHINILPGPKGSVLEMEHERSGWRGPHHDTVSTGGRCLTQHKA
jgi:hypothetical protein